MTSTTSETITPKAVEQGATRHVEVSHFGSVVREHHVLLRRCNQYDEAQSLVDYLVDEGFPCERIAIVAYGLSLIEHVSSHTRWPRRVLGDVAGGALMGLLIGLFLGTIVIEPTSAWLALLLWSTILGAGLGGLFSIFELFFTGGHRDVHPVGAMTAERFDVLVDREDEERAKELLTKFDPAIAIGSRDDTPKR